MVSASGDLFGMFIVPKPEGVLQIITTDGDSEDGCGWEHVSVTFVTRKGKARIPTWNEMCEVKRMFWSDDETVVQFHPAVEHYVNFHQHVLHLWKRRGAEFDLPPRQLI